MPPRPRQLAAAGPGELVTGYREGIEALDCLGLLGQVRQELVWGGREREREGEKGGG